MDTVLRLNNVSYHYQDGMRQVDILKECNYEFEKGKTYAVVGASGSGKTTLLVLAGGLESPADGAIEFEGKDISKLGLTKYRRDCISMVFQAYNLIGYMNAYQNVISAMDISKMKIRNKKEKALAILEKLGLGEKEAKRDIRRLSGGQQQRVAIGRAVAKDADLILADEPTGNLDEETSEGIIKSFIDLAHVDNKCVIIVTHSKDFAKRLDVQLKIKDGQLVDAELD